MGLLIFILHLCLSVRATFVDEDINALSSSEEATCSKIFCWVDPEDVEKSKLEVAGKEYRKYDNDLSINLHIGRAYHLDGVLPGKWNDRNNFLHISYQQLELDKSAFEVLKFIPGSLSWIKYSSQDLVVGGFFPETHQTLYICRAHQGSDLVIGYVLNGAECSVPYYGIEYRHRSFEVLALNDYGRLLMLEDSPIDWGSENAADADTGKENFCSKFLIMILVLVAFLYN